MSHAPRPVSRVRKLFAACSNSAGIWCNLLIVILFAIALWAGLTLLGWAPPRSGFSDR
jgi:hypothetical protein